MSGTAIGSRSKTRRLLLSLRLLVVILLVLPIFGCIPTDFEWPEVSEGDWATYTNGIVGYSLRYPAACTVHEHRRGRSVLIRYDGAPIIAVNFVDEREGRRRGLWVEHSPVDSLTLAGRSGHKYVYDHFDGPFGMHTVSYVVPHGDRLLGIEFRAAEVEPSSVQRQILDSLDLG